MRDYSPLRYPGGKGKLGKFFCELVRQNGVADGIYYEPYAGGAAVGLRLLMTKHVRHIHLNDVYTPLYYFWLSAVNYPDDFCKKVMRCKVSIPAWRRHKNILQNWQSHDPWEVGFSFFFLNRTCRSGIVGGGVIGGLRQRGKWTIGARFNKVKLCERIRQIAMYRNHITFHNRDAEEFISNNIHGDGETSIVYLDPPYYRNSHRLYMNHYRDSDHVRLSEKISEIQCPWVMTYDDVPEIREAYQYMDMYSFRIKYNAARKYVGRELMIVNGVVIPCFEEFGLKGARLQKA